MAGVDATYEECFNSAQIREIDGIRIPVLHIQHLIQNKRAVGCPKDQSDVEKLEAIKMLQQKNKGTED
ncbi:MAG TPA: hypothetical protein VGN63_15270 [Flavisolibacter sp.]|nr:hypothetical protein [Flavisolibacter sp.]